MELSIGRQLLELVAAIGLGIGLGLVYDIFRVLRLHSGKLMAFFWDLCFCLLMALALFCLGMGPGGGDLRLYMPAAAAVGAGMYFAFFSRLWLGILLPLGRAAERSAARVGKMGKSLILQAKKYLKILKNIFSRVKKRFTINKLKPDEDRQKRRGGSGNEVFTEGGAENELRKGRNIYPDSYSGAYVVCAGQPVHHGRKAGLGKGTFTAVGGNAADPEAAKP